MRQPAPAPAGIVAFSRAYPGRPDQIGAVRSDLRALLASCPMRADIILCASELATIEVEDEGGPWTEATPDLTRGHGLDIIRALASDNGIDGDCTSRAVWARLDWPESG
jgi:hypothetical protein